MALNKHEAYAYLRGLAERIALIPVEHGTDQDDCFTLDEIADLIQTDFAVNDHRIEDVLKRMNGNPDSFRMILTDRTELLAKVCDYADNLADRRRTEPWVIMKEIFGHGSGVSSAIFQIYGREG